jgi:hypothetical protein
VLKALSLFLLTVLLVAYQNCAKVGFGGLTSLQSFKSNANGENYDGKLFVHADPANPCADQNVNRSVIELTASGYQLIKRDCVPLSPPLPLTTADIQVDPVHPGRFTYQSDEFIFDTSNLTRKPDLECVPTNFGPVDSVKVYSVTGANGPMLVGQAIAFGTTVNLAFGESVLDTSASASLNGIGQSSSTYLSLFGFDPTAQLPSGGNTTYQGGVGELGAEGFLSCTRPSGSL